MPAEIGTDRKRLHRNCRQLLHTAFEEVLGWRNENRQQGNGDIGNQKVKIAYPYCTY